MSNPSNPERPVSEPAPPADVPVSPLAKDQPLPRRQRIRMLVFLLVAVAIAAAYLVWKERKARHLEDAQSHWQVVIEDAAGQARTESLDARQGPEVVADRLAAHLREVIADRAMHPVTRPEVAVLAIVHFRYGQEGFVTVEDQDRAGRPRTRSISMQTSRKALLRGADGRLFYAMHGRGAEAKLHEEFFATETEAVASFAAYMARELAQMHKANQQSLLRASPPDDKKKGS